jgi:hypothetical protein
MLDGVIMTGEATWSDNLLLELGRFDYPEECYFSFSFSTRGERLHQRCIYRRHRDDRETDCGTSPQHPA